MVPNNRHETTRAVILFTLSSLRFYYIIDTNFGGALIEFLMLTDSDKIDILKCQNAFGLSLIVLCFML